MNPEKTKPDHELTAALRIVDEAAEAIRESCPGNLTRKEAARLQRRFKTRLQPPEARTKPGKPASELVTKALELRSQSVAWHRVYWEIPGYKSMSDEARHLARERLQDAVRKRRQRRQRPLKETSAAPQDRDKPRA